MRENPDVNKLIENLPEHIQELVDALRELIFQASPGLVEEVKWSKPSYAENGLVCYLAPAKNHVNLGFYRGSELENDGLLQGSGKQMRHIQVKKLEDINSQAFIAKIQEAILLNT